MKNYLLVTGGAGFVGTNLIKFLLRKTKYKIISLDNYSSGSKENHLSNKRLKYINGDTKDISNIFKNYNNKIKTIFHFGEFSRIYKSFENINSCLESNSIGSLEVFKYCLENKIKLIYSATSAGLGSKNKNLSPYAFTKSKNLEYLENLKRWFNFKYEVIYFYNVYGPYHIKVGEMATVIGIFEDQYLNNSKLTVVRPGYQSRKFTHIDDTIRVCFEAWKKDQNKHYSIFYNKNYSILAVAKMFNSKIKFLPFRKGERYASVLTKMNLNNRIIHRKGKINLKNYISNFIKINKKS
ncbi:NAD-dependent epimerase/dehydratase family protein [Candidatus Pelagibacter sp.]|nr:NAD-dependent epimerase/dehydratase family protein [Candidatus Pelagibacter sp.]